MKSLLKTTMFGFAGFVLFSSPAMAAWTFSQADLVIGFQATGGQGGNTDLFFNLGNSYSLNVGTAPLGLRGNINDDLVATYGSNWSTRSDLYFGAIANFSRFDPEDVLGVPGVSDPGATIYVSAAANSVGTAGLRPQFGVNALISTGSNIAGLKGVLGTLTETANLDGVASLSSDVTAQASAFINNGWGKWNPLPGGAAFGTLTGGIQQNFGQVGSDNIIDIQRMVGNTATEYVASVVIGDNGSVSVVPETSSSILSIIIGTAAVCRRRRNRA